MFVYTITQLKLLNSNKADGGNFPATANDSAYFLTNLIIMMYNLKSSTHNSKVEAISTNPQTNDHTINKMYELTRYK